MSDDTHQSARLLLADSDPLVAGSLTRLFGRGGYAVKCAHDGSSAMRLLNAEHFHVAVFGVELATNDGWELLERAMRLEEPPKVIMTAQNPGVQDAVRAMRRGAYDFLSQPIDFSDLRSRIERLLETATMQRRMKALELDHGGPDCVIESPRMVEARQLADQIANTPRSSALILGESGVGKEVIATYIHERSARRTAPFVRVNLAAIPESMVEAELFGSVRGAFTDSKRDRAGFFAMADGGTILLDELGEFRPELQSKLLRVLEERKFYPVGSDRERHIDVRVVASTNKDPLDLMRRGLLREDLYYRLSVGVIHLAPLRERAEDILPLARYFLRSFATEFGKPCDRLSEAAEDMLLHYGWPGNVRELRNTIERAVMFANSPMLETQQLNLRPAISASGSFPAAQRVSEHLVITQKDGDQFFRVPATLGDELNVLRTPDRLQLQRLRVVGDMERVELERALDSAGGSKSKAAQLLGISRTTLWEKLKKYGLSTRPPKR